jgi:hypothetical protein
MSTMLVSQVACSNQRHKALLTVQGAHQKIRQSSRRSPGPFRYHILRHWSPANISEFPRSIAPKLSSRHNDASDDERFLIPLNPSGIGKSDVGFKKIAHGCSRDSQTGLNFHR